MINNTPTLLEKINPLKQQLLNHDLYKYIETPDDLRIFTQHHVFEVWDSMSLVKCLQQKLTNINVPWTPRQSPKLTYFINDMVLAEESDVNLNGKRQSHFEMYLQAMEELKASTFDIHKFIEQVDHGTDIFLVISASELPEPVKSFLIFTFNTIYHEQLHQVAAAFVFGREELIPDTFCEILGEIEEKFPEENISNLKYYFQRRLDIDRDIHRPMAIQLIEDICQNHSDLWQNVEEVAVNALHKRLNLWNGILKEVLKQKAIA